MKIWELFIESPPDLGKVAPFVFNNDGEYISISSLEREFHFLGSYNLDDVEYKFWMRNSVTKLATRPSV